MIRYICGLIILMFTITTSAQKIEDILDEQQIEIMDNSSVSDTPALIGRLEALESRMHDLEQAVSKLKPEIQVENHTHSHKQQENPNISTGNEKKDYDKALSTFKGHEFGLSIDLFAEFIHDYPESKLLSNAYFWYGESYFRQEMFDQASVHFFQGYKKAPKGSKASDSLLKLAASLGHINKVKEACVTLDKLNKEFPKRTVVSMKKATEIYKKLECKK